MTTRLAAALVTLAALCAAAPPAHADAFVLFGDGLERLRPGILAGDASVAGAPPAVAAREDGTIAVTAGLAVYVIREGRLLRAPVPLGRSDARLTIAFAPDGSLLVGVCPGFDTDDEDQAVAAVFRAWPGRTAQRLAGRVRGTGRSGDGGPATAAALACPTSISADREGNVLILDEDRVRRIDPNGVITTVAGPGREGEPGDGGPATAAWLGNATAVAALPGGGFAISERDRFDTRGEVARRGVVRVVDREGRIATRAAVSSVSLAAAPDGTLLAASADEEEPHIRRIHADGRVELAADLSERPAGVPGGIPVAGDPLADDDVVVGAVAVTPDGGILASRDFRIVYVAPATPRVLGIALLSRTRVPRATLQVHLRSTLAGRARVEVRRDGRRVAVASADVPDGDAVVTVPARLRPNVYEVRVTVEAAGQAAVAGGDVIVGGVLPLHVAREFLETRSDAFELLVDAPETALRCRRVSAGQIDCGMVQERRCVGVAVIRLLADGTLSASAYDGGNGRRCRFRRPPL